MERTQARRILASASAGRFQRLVLDCLDSTSAVVNPQTWFDRCTFVGTDLRLATLDGAHFKMCNLHRANLRGASLRGTSFVGCDLQDVDLRDADLSGAQLSYVNTGADHIGRTNVTGAQLSGSVMRAVVADRVIGWHTDEP